MKLLLAVYGIIVNVYCESFNSFLTTFAEENAVAVIQGLNRRLII